MDRPICLPNIKIYEDDLMYVIKRDGETVIIDQTIRIADPESIVYTEARRQLAEEHPEAFR